MNKLQVNIVKMMMSLNLTANVSLSLPCPDSKSKGCSSALRNTLLAPGTDAKIRPAALVAAFPDCDVPTVAGRPGRLQELPRKFGGWPCELQSAARAGLWTGFGALGILVRPASAL